jgi:hypothetical protein
MSTWVKCTAEDETIVHINLDSVLYLAEGDGITDIFLVGSHEAGPITVLERPEEILAAATAKPS